MRTHLFMLCTTASSRALVFPVNSTTTLSACALILPPVLWALRYTPVYVSGLLSLPNTPLHRHQHEDTRDSVTTAVTVAVAHNSCTRARGGE
jgi:hypothetical protein